METTCMAAEGPITVRLHVAGSCAEACQEAADTALKAALKDYRTGQGTYPSLLSAAEEAAAVVLGIRHRRGIPCWIHVEVDVVEDANRVLTVRITPTMYRTLKARAAHEGIRVSDLVRRSLKQLIQGK